MKEKNRNIILCVLVIMSIFFMTTFFYDLLSFIKNENFRNLLANMLYLTLLIIIYRKELYLGIKDLKKNYKKILNIGFKYWTLGVFIMVVSNLIINLVIFKGEIATNESLVREILLKNPILGIVSSCIIAPIMEEIIFRASLKRVINKKYIYAATTGLIFGLLHALTGISSIIDFVYIIPYGALGFYFGLMYYETNNLYTSIIMHMIHNTLSCVLIFSVLG